MQASCWRHWNRLSTNDVLSIGVFSSITATWNRKADSTGRRNILVMNVRKEMVESFGGGFQPRVLRGGVCDRVECVRVRRVPAQAGVWSHD